MNNNEKEYLGDPSKTHVNSRILMTNRGNINHQMDQLNNPKTDYNTAIVKYTSGETRVFKIKSYYLGNSILCLDLKDGGACWIVIQNIKQIDFDNFKD